MGSIADKLRGLKNLNYTETETEIPGYKITLSTLSGAEDRDIADYLLVHREKSQGHYIKIETLAHSIKKIVSPEETIDLKGLTHIETGEINSADIPVKVRRHVFMRDIVSTWDESTLDALYLQFALLTEKLQKGIDKLSKVELGDATLMMKIEQSLSEVESMVRDAKNRGIQIPEDVLSFFDRKPIGGEADLLAASLQKIETQKKIEKIIEEEVPQRIRK